MLRKISMVLVAGAASVLLAGSVAAYADDGIWEAPQVPQAPAKQAPPSQEAAPVGATGIQAPGSTAFPEEKAPVRGITKPVPAEENLPGESGSDMNYGGNDASLPVRAK
jgi:hypothetical protein